MIYSKLLIVIVLFFSGCGGADIEELKALNAPKDKNYSSISPNNTEIVQSTAIAQKTAEVGKKITKVNSTSPIPTKEPIPTQLIKKLTDKEIKYKLALEKIKKEMELTTSNSNFKLSLTQLENQKEIDLKTAELSLAKLDMENKLELARIELEKAKEEEKTKQLAQTQENQKEIEIAKTKQAIAQDEEKNRALQIKENMEFYKIVAAIVGILLIFTLLIIYLLKRRKEANIAKREENELKQKMQFKIMEEQSKNLDKMLEIVKSKDLSQSVEKEILSTIKESQKRTLIFEEKPKKGLIFRK